MVGLTTHAKHFGSEVQLYPATVYPVISLILRLTVEALLGYARVISATMVMNMRQDRDRNEKNDKQKKKKKKSSHLAEVVSPQQLGSIWAQAAAVVVAVWTSAEQMLSD